MSLNAKLSHNDIESPTNLIRPNTEWNFGTKIYITCPKGFVYRHHGSPFNPQWFISALITTGSFRGAIE